jgi:hypothetical protein
MPGKYGEHTRWAALRLLGHQKFLTGVTRLAITRPSRRFAVPHGEGGDVYGVLTHPGLIPVTAALLYLCLIPLQSGRQISRCLLLTCSA